MVRPIYKDSLDRKQLQDNCQVSSAAVHTFTLENADISASKPFTQVAPSVTRSAQTKRRAPQVNWVTS